MDDKQQICAFAGDLDRLVERYRSEFELTYAAVVGTLFMKAQLLTKESDDFNDDDP